MTAAPPNLAVLTRIEAARYLRLNPRTFNKEVQAGRLPPPLPLISRRKLWSKAAIDRAIEQPSAAPEVDPLMERIRAHYAKAG